MQFVRGPFGYAEFFLNIHPKKLLLDEHECIVELTMSGHFCKDVLG